LSDQAPPLPAFFPTYETMSERYRFRPGVDDFQRYPDGTEVPCRFSMIERMRQDGTWEPVGYAEIQLLKVIRDGSGDEDISLSFSGLVSQDLAK